ncbi:MAG TPA: NAD(+)/NADH kinase [Acidimicrobiia bacterium]
MKVYLELREERPAVDQFSRKLVDALQNRGVAVTTVAGEADLVIAVGGDGTMLSAAAVAHAADLPVLGFNLGTLGFLTTADPEDLQSVVSRLVDGDYDIDNRMTVAARTHGGVFHGVNDVVIEKVDNQRLVELEVAIGGVEFATYRSDGLIVASPTGSTAYSFSAGGPLVSPAVDAIVLTPVAAHSLFSRSIVLPAEQEITITVHRDRAVKVSVDKQNLGELGNGDKVVVTRGDRPVQFVTFGSPSFAGLVKDKFDLP